MQQHYKTELVGPDSGGIPFEWLPAIQAVALGIVSFVGILFLTKYGEEEA